MLQATPHGVRYFITFSSYGAHVHGDEGGTVDRGHNHPGGRLVEPDPRWSASGRLRMNDPPCTLDRDGRAVVLESLKGTCIYRGWELFAAHVRSNHVHVIAGGEDTPEKMMSDFKAYASRALNRIDPPRRRWARHGSTRWLWKDRDVRDAIRYVVEEQGEPMAVFVSDGF